MNKSPTNLQVDFQAEIENILVKIISQEINKKAARSFYDILNTITVEKCETKCGWKSGVALSVTCKFTKGNSNKIIFELIKGIDNKPEIFSFLCGLSPDIFHFNPDYVYENTNNLFLTFKLVRYERIKDI